MIHEGLNCGFHPPLQHWACGYAPVPQDFTSVVVCSNPYFLSQKSLHVLYLPALFPALQKWSLPEAVQALASDVRNCCPGRKRGQRYLPASLKIWDNERAVWQLRSTVKRKVATPDVQKAYFSWADNVEPLLDPSCFGTFPVLSISYQSKTW